MNLQDLVGSKSFVTVFGSPVDGIKVPESQVGIQPPLSADGGKNRPGLVVILVEGAEISGKYSKAPMPHLMAVPNTPAKPDRKMEGMPQNAAAYHVPLDWNTARLDILVGPVHRLFCTSIKKARLELASHSWGYAANPGASTPRSIRYRIEIRATTLGLLSSFYPGDSLVASVSGEVGVLGTTLAPMHRIHPLLICGERAELACTGGSEAGDPNRNYHYMPPKILLLTAQLRFPDRTPESVSIDEPPVDPTLVASELWRFGNPDPLAWFPPDHPAFQPREESAG